MGIDFFDFDIDGYIADHLLENGVVIAVRCEDCDVPHNKFTGYPKLNGLIPPPNYYCAGGEQKKNDKE